MNTHLARLSLLLLSFSVTLHAFVTPRQVAGGSTNFDWTQVCVILMLSWITDLGNLSRRSSLNPLLIGRAATVRVNVPDSWRVNVLYTPFNLV